MSAPSHTAVSPVTRAWVSTGGTGAQNYDEFADDAEVTQILRDNPHSALAVEMPHRAPGADPEDFAAALPAAGRRWAQAQQEARYRAVEQMVAVYRISADDGPSSLGLFAMVDTGEISTEAGQPGRVIRNEDVFIGKVRQRVALVQQIGHLLSAVLLVQTERAEELQAALARVCTQAGEPDVVDHDAAGRRHEVWTVTDEDTVARLCSLAGGGELVVADGNHRTLAAQLAGLDEFLAVITTASSLALRPYHRLIRDWPAQMGEPLQALSDAGAHVEPADLPLDTPLTAGVMHVYTAGRGYSVRLPSGDPDAPAVDRMDHSRVEQLVLRDLLRWDPADERITYVGGDYPASWLCAAVDDGRADLALLIAPVTVEDFVRVNKQRSAMPRKSTWFVPKARAGLVVADVR
ncbi:MAG TPA: DUF1015 family protein [Ornithinimicrobium sp.]|uniref:DUF1015 family protein n=1 Tax=Ornithinimicrobium sp. TaxID=1977084 RepID=UPI002B459FC8|nr:DUF1015 family protein [Ornithinimicrobium sp.]HKJ11989.1 DUF1015 family protein [Ornithinimicrobium sp.]